MAKKGKKGAQAGGDFWDDEDMAQDQPQAEEFGTPLETATPDPEAQPETASAGPEEASAEDISGDFLSSIRKNKQKKTEKEENEKANANNGGAPKLLSKKEKEKLKKEAEKQKKKEQAQKKKAQQASKKEQIKEANKQNAAAAASSASPSSSAVGTPEPEDEAPVETAKSKPAKKGKKAQLIEKEQLKAEGKLLTKKQKEEKKLQERRRQQLLQAGNVSVAGLNKTDDDTPKPKKVVYTKKKSTKPKTFIQKPAPTKAPAAKTEDDEDEALVDDWEKMALDDDEPVVDDWEAA
ncbi:hypothetical protein Cantr_05746 [Candida viswanathii]|uniref:Eukaryotic translation initiation factor 5B n=1 Tax=Candida viswanathii TaxID=5486 RepID=A0A367XQJ3_9ASCO|nr:hypothetical protein Cantr_05746 [Candida viswanathii]